MSTVSLPEQLRPRGVSYKKFAPGLDFPCWFFDSLKTIDKDFHLIYHPYKVLWDDIINEYSGGTEDPRYQVNFDHGELNFGWVLTDGEGRPREDGSWHLWRLCWPHGWAHIVEIQSKEIEYLFLLVNRLSLQAAFTERYGHKAWSRQVEEETTKATEKHQEDQQDLFNAVQKENKWLMDKAAENFERGKTKPTNPQKEQVMSYAGQTHRSRVSRPMTDEEGGLVIPD